MAETNTTRRAREDALIARALKALERRMREPESRYSITGECAAREYVRLALAELEREAFAVIYVDAQLRVLEHEVLFHGTLTQTPVYPREIARGALRVNAAAVVLVHNHPSGSPRFSESDALLTEHIRNALSPLEVKVLDHLLVAGGVIRSLEAEQSLERDAHRAGRKAARQAERMGEIK